MWGFTTPLIVKPDGTKYGKTESGTIWLDAERTSPFAMYQFFLNTPDEQVGDLLRYLTFLGHEEIGRSMPIPRRTRSAAPPNGPSPAPSSGSCTARARWPSARRPRRPSSARRSHA